MTILEESRGSIGDRSEGTLKPVGYMPCYGGHHDSVIVPTKVEHLLNSRCTTL